jgi:hypothetical protein
MRRLLALLILAVALAVAVAACSAPANNPCLYDGGLRYSHLSYNGQTLLVVCKDGKIIVRKP